MTLSAVYLGEGPLISFDFQGIYQEKGENPQPQD